MLVLKEELSWIYLPKEVEYFVSNDEFNLLNWKNISKRNR